MDENKSLATEEVVDADAIMQEFDRESNVRVFTGWRKKVITGLMAAFSVYVVLMALVLQNATKHTKLTTFMAFILFIGYLIFPAYIKLYGMNWDGIIETCSAANPLITNIPTFVAFSVIPFNVISRAGTSVIAMMIYKKISVPLKKMLED